MSFFEPPPPPPEPPEEFRQPAWIGPPGNELGVSVALNAIVARNERAVIAVLGCTAFSSGVVLDMTLRTRPGTISAREQREMHGSPFHLHGRLDPGEELPANLVRIGVLFADGRKGTSLNDRRAFFGQEQPEGPILTPRGGGGGQGVWNVDYWLWPLPPAGPLTIVAAWPGFGIDETRVELDATPIAEAAKGVVTLWPEGEPSSGGGFSAQHVYAVREKGQTDGE
jgi:hypothetical protein